MNQLIDYIILEYIVIRMWGRKPKEFFIVVAADS